MSGGVPLLALFLVARRPSPAITYAHSLLHTQAVHRKSGSCCTHQMAAPTTLYNAKRPYGMLPTPATKGANVRTMGTNRASTTCKRGAASLDCEPMPHSHANALVKKNGSRGVTMTHESARQQAPCVRLSRCHIASCGLLCAGCSMVSKRCFTAKACKPHSTVHLQHARRYVNTVWVRVRCSTQKGCFLPKHSPTVLPPYLS